MSNETAEDYLKLFPLLHTKDLDESRSVMGALWSRHEVWVTAGTSFETTVNHSKLEETGITFVRCPCPIKVKAYPTPDRYTIYLHEEGAAEHRINGKRFVSSPEQTLILGPNLEIEMDAGPVRLLSLEFEGSTVRSAMAARYPDRPTAAHILAQKSLHLPMLSRLQGLSRWAALELDKAGSDLLKGVAAKQLSGLLLSLLVETLADDGRSQKHKDPMLGKMRLIDLENWIESQLREDLTLETLSRQAGVSTRAVQHAFRRYRNCTPMEFIRSKRLGAVRRQLQAREGKVNITEIAMQHGFYHMSHFTRFYRLEFGETPTETLRAAPPCPSED